jgi:hypothetical protein
MPLQTNVPMLGYFPIIATHNKLLPLTAFINSVSSSKRRTS